MGANCRQPKDVGGELHRSIALRSATRHPQLADRGAGPFLQPLHSLTQSIRQPFQDRTVQMGARVNVGEPDHSPPRLRARHPDARAPIGLQHQAVTPRRHTSDQLVQQTFGSNPTGFGLLYFALAELLFEPAHHPKTAIDLDLQVVGAGLGCRKRRDQGQRFQITRGGGRDRGGGAVAETADLRVKGAGAEHLTGFVGCSGDQRQPGRNPGGCRCGRADRAQWLGWSDQFGQASWVDRRNPPLPVPGGSPALGFIIERKIADLTADRVDKMAGQLEGQIAGQQKIFVGLGPDVRFMGPDPVAFGFGLDVGDRLAQACQLESHPPQTPDWMLAQGTSLVQPEDGWAQRAACPIDVDDCGTLRSQGHAGHPLSVSLCPHPLAGSTEAAPEILWVLLRPAWLARKIGLDRHLGFGHQHAL